MKPADLQVRNHLRRPWHRETNDRLAFKARVRMLNSMADRKFLIGVPYRSLDDLWADLKARRWVFWIHGGTVRPMHFGWVMNFPLPLIANGVAAGAFRRAIHTAPALPPAMNGGLS